jgi:hypothetical protein
MSNEELILRFETDTTVPRFQSRLAASLLQL